MIATVVDLESAIATAKEDNIQLNFVEGLEEDVKAVKKDIHDMEIHRDMATGAALRAEIALCIRVRELEEEFEPQVNMNELRSMSHEQQRTTLRSMSVKPGRIRLSFTLME